jgi:hypothetical protein
MDMREPELNTEVIRLRVAHTIGDDGTADELDRRTAAALKVVERFEAMGFSARMPHEDIAAKRSISVLVCLPCGLDLYRVWMKWDPEEGRWRLSGLVSNDLKFHKQILSAQEMTR